MSQIELRPGLADVPVAESAVSYIDGKNARLEYRGIAVETLATESCFEETSYLLLKGDLPTQKQLADFDDQEHAHHYSISTSVVSSWMPEFKPPMTPARAMPPAVSAMRRFPVPRMCSRPSSVVNFSPSAAWRTPWATSRRFS